MVNTYPEIQLTEMELAVMKFAALSSAEIANELKIKRRTVEKYLQNINEKLGSRSKADAVIKCIRWGILHVDQFREVIK